MWFTNRDHHGAGVDSGRSLSTIFAEAGAGPGVGFLNENRTQSRSENFSFYRSRTIDFIKFKLSLNGELLD